MTRPASSRPFAIDAYDLAVVAGIAAHFYLRQQFGVQPSGSSKSFPAFLPSIAIIPWSGICLWCGVRVPELKKVFQCLSGFLLFTVSAPLLAIVRDLPPPFPKDGSPAYFSLVFAAYCGAALVPRSFGMSYPTAVTTPMFRKWLRLPWIASGAFALSLFFDLYLEENPLVPALSFWSFSVPFALIWFMTRQLDPEEARQQFASPDLWGRWLSTKRIVSAGGLIILGGSAMAVFLRTSRIFHATPEHILQQVSWGPRYIFLLRQGYLLWWPIASILLMEMLVLLRIHSFAQLAGSAAVMSSSPPGMDSGAEKGPSVAHP